VAGLGAPAGAEPTAEQETYWWQDEIRTVAQDVSKARTGRVAQWPRMTVPAGSATLPLPKAAGPVVADGKLDEKAWAHATRFPVGPVFAPWREGPLTLQVRACRDENTAYLAIESPRDLTDLGSLGPAGELFHADKPYRVGTGGGLPERAVGKDGQRQIIELALPLPKADAPLSLSFSAELVGRPGGKFPPALAAMGLSRHGKLLWLQPFVIKLVRAKSAVQLTWTTDDADPPRLSHRLLEPGEDARAGQAVAPSKTSGTVRLYSWKTESLGKTYQFDGFAHAEPVREILKTARDQLERTASGPLARELAELQAQAQKTTPNDGRPWRELYCRARALRARVHLGMLDAPLLFVKQHPYFAGHIYDDYYTWHPGGGIYILEDPAHAKAQPSVRTVIDARSDETLGEGVYRDPELSWDGRKLVFAYRSGPQAGTAIHEIGVDGTGLRRLTKDDGYHDITPCYAPDGRIVFTSTRPGALVPCFNSGVDTLHSMNGDGSDIRSISSNIVNEFDPSILPDGRILYGRWEYLDKTALYMQSLWTVAPDGTMETALFANNLAKPTAVLDARPVPGTELVVASLTPHNGQAVGAIATINPVLGKNELGAITNFTPEYPAEMDQGLRTGPCDPWPLSPDHLLISNNAIGGHGIIEFIDRFGNRELVHCDADISCYAPMLVKPQQVPPVTGSVAADSDPGRFLVLDIYHGLDGVPRGTVKRLRVIEETGRASSIPPGGRWWNQAFLVSWQGAYIVKNVLGTVPVHADGSAYFEVPPGRAVYFEALDADGREIQRMRTYVQAVPGVTRSCIGCHESKGTSPPRSARTPLALDAPPARPEPESWGAGYVDYATMIQPILDRHCVSCHGGSEGIAGGIDLSGGWTWAFNLSYETLLKNRLVGFLRCHNSDVTSSVILPPRTLGSGSAPLAKLVLSGHDGHIDELSTTERDLLFAWMDTNSNYYGTWDHTQYATCDALLAAAPGLTAAMRTAGCTQCHAPDHIGNDWVNLERPEWSRILRAPMGETPGGLGLGWCREAKASKGMPLVTQALHPPDVFHTIKLPERNAAGSPHITLASTADPHFQTMLRIIRRAKAEALGHPRVDMPGAQIEPGVCRRQVAVPLPDSLPGLRATLTDDHATSLRWPLSGTTVGLEFELHRASARDFVPTNETLIARTTSFRFTDYSPPSGRQHYALVAESGTDRSGPVRAAITVPPASPPPPAHGLTATPRSGEIALH